MNLDLDFVLPLMGAAFIFLGLMIRSGSMKPVYWKSRRSAYGYIPLGLVFIAAGFYERAQEQPPAVFYAYIAIFAIVIALTLYFGAKPPEFMKPNWVRWIEKHPKSIQKAMAAEVEAGEEWKNFVVSERAVDAWARRLGLKMPKKSSKTNKG